LTVRVKLALTIFFTGVLTALGVVVAVVFAMQRFEHETTYYRADAFLGRVVSMYSNIFDMHERQPEEFSLFLHNLVLFEPDTQLYLLDPAGTVLASTGSVKLAPGFKVDIAPVKSAVGPSPMPYVMGDDPERMDADAVIAARPVQRASIRGNDAVAGYLYLVSHNRKLPEGRMEVLTSSFAKPALVAILGVVTLMTLLAAWVIVTVTRPLRQLTHAMSTVSEQGVEDSVLDIAEARLPHRSDDEFGQLTTAFRMMLDTCRRQWAALRRLDHFRREGVSNLSHDLRSPLTATAACLETLDGRWQGDALRDDDRRLLEVALRNTRNAARLVKSLGDLAQLDEPQFQLHAERFDVGELLDDIALRFAPRAAAAGVEVRFEPASEADAPVPAALLDVELFERAIANLIDNALKFSRAGGRITLSARVRDERVEVGVADTGAGIAASDVPHLFDRFYQSRHSVAPATGEGGKGLGLAIVKRIAELHGGSVTVASEPGRGTTVTLSLPSAAA
jgi:signal transduction histidine kinase